MIYENLIKTNKDQFLAKVRNICQLLNINPDWLMAVMYKESAGTFRPDIQNTKFPFKNKDGSIIGYATGLIQFTPGTAAFLGTTTQALKSMSNVQQLDYVYKYFKGWTGKIKSYSDLYLVTFLPIAVGKPDDWILQTKTLRPDIIAKYNPGIDLNKDGKITVAEFREYSMRNLTTAVQEILKKKM